MASRRSLTKSVVKGSDDIRQSTDDSLLVFSDEYHEVQCSTCERDGKNMNAEMYCVECDQNLCQTCVKQHNKFESMKSHQLVESKLDSGNNRMLDLPSQRCQNHHGKLLDVYCQDHDQVCCGACVYIHHRSCGGLSYIPQMAKGINVSRDGNQVLEQMKKLQSQAKSLIKDRRVLVKDLKEEKVRILDEIKDTCFKIVEHFKKLETNILAKLDYKVNDLEDIIQREINETGDVLSTLNQEQQLLVKYLSADDTSSLFVQLKLAEKCHSNCTDILNQIKSPYTRGLEFSANLKANDIFNEIQTIGDIIENKTIESFNLHGDFDVKTPNDESICDITDVILHNDGTLLITDFENKCLKRLDSQYRVVESRSLPGKPHSVCFVDRSTAAVALTDINTVQLVNVKESMAASSSFKVGYHCRGIAYKDGCIYVTCGGRYKYGESRGRLEVYSCSGKHLRTYDSNMSVPKHILKHKFGHLIYITDSKGLITMTTHGRILKTLTYRDIDKPVGICSGPGIQYFLCGYNSHTIVLLSGNVHQLHTLRADGVRRPQALCFDRVQSRLIVAMDTTNTLKVLQLSFE